MAYLIELPPNVEEYRPSTEYLTLWTPPKGYRRTDDWERIGDRLIDWTLDDDEASLFSLEEAATIVAYLETFGIDVTFRQFRTDGRYND